MLIGMTYDLKDEYIQQGFTNEEAAEFDSLETIEAIEEAIKLLGHNVERIGNVKALVTALAHGKTWDLVFNICEGVNGISRESQVPCLLEAYNIPYTFSSPETNAITMDKSVAKQLVANAGVATAPFKVVRNISDIDKLDIPFPLFVKPLAEGTGKGIDARSNISDKESLRSKCEYLLKTFNQPVLVESYLSGRDITVGIVGNGKNAKVIAVMETFYDTNAESLSQSFYNKKNYEEVLQYRIIDDDVAKKAAEASLKSWETLNCRDAGRFDFRCDKNNTPYFLELNPLAGLHPIDSDLPMLSRKVGIDFNQLIAMIINCAIERYGLCKTKEGVVA